MDDKDEITMKVTFHDRINDLYEFARDGNYKIGRTAFAEICGVTKWQMNGYLSRKTEPSASTLRKIAQSQNVSVSWLIGETEVRNFHTVELIEGLSSPIVDELVRYAKYLQYKENEDKKIRAKNSEQSS